MAVWEIRGGFLLFYKQLQDQDFIKNEPVLS